MMDLTRDSYGNLYNPTSINNQRVGMIENNSQINMNGLATTNYVGSAGVIRDGYYNIVGSVKPISNFNNKLFR